MIGLFATPITLLPFTNSLVQDALVDAALWAYNNPSQAGHLFLDAVGLVPGLGEPADAINSIWYSLEGDTTNAALSLAAAVPIVGWFSTGGKYFSKVTGALPVTAFKQITSSIGSFVGTTLDYVKRIRIEINPNPGLFSFGPDLFSQTIKIKLVPRGLIDGFDFGKHLRELIGDPPKGMVDPHAHHILFKKGLGPAQQALVEEGQAILRKVGIDPIYGKDNLIWAPWRVAEQHGIESLTKVVDELRALDRAGGDYNDFVDLLKKLGRIAAERS